MRSIKNTLPPSKWNAHSSGCTENSASIKTHFLSSQSLRTIHSVQPEHRQIFCLPWEHYRTHFSKMLWLSASILPSCFTKMKSTHELGSSAFHLSFCRLSNRAATLTASPIVVNFKRSVLPKIPTITGPMLIPSLIRIDPKPCCSYQALNRTISCSMATLYLTTVLTLSRMCSSVCSMAKTPNPVLIISP